jgi:hypothetical protein
MRDRLLQLAERIHDECNELARLLERAEEAWRQAQQTGDDLYLDSVALNLHSFYAGLERLFERIGSTVDGELPRGENWHQVLLDQMASEVRTVRPAVISESTRDTLNEYRGFRHIVRNVYATRLDPVKIEKLVQAASPTFGQVHAELIAFAEFLEHRASQD